MAEVAKHADLAAANPSKRKREAPSSPECSRRSKRTGVPAAAMTEPDATTAAFIESAVSAAAVSAAQAAQAVAAAQQQDQVNVEDFKALQQAAASSQENQGAAAAGEAADPANASSTAAAALGSMYPTLHVPQTTEETFAASQAAGGSGGGGASSNDEQHGDASFNASTGAGASSMSPNGGAHEGRYGGSSSTSKPSVGSEEWHKQRKDNHKEVERRRRETINEGINELAKIVPGCEKNKGSILQRAVAFITQLKENEQQNIEKWTLEKLLTEQAIAELSTSNDKLKQECERLYREVETWKKAAQSSGSDTVSKDEAATAD